MNDQFFVEVHPTAFWLLCAFFRKLNSNPDKHPRIGVVVSGAKWKTYGFTGERFAGNGDPTEPKGASHD